MKKFVFVLLAIIIIALLSGCRAADVASRNISNAADNFEVMRRVVFINGITDEYLLEIIGLCSLGNYDLEGEVSVTCKTGVNSYKKHFLGLSDNVTYMAEQLDDISVSTYYYRVIFRPTVLVPDIELDIR